MSQDLSSHLCVHAGAGLAQAAACLPHSCQTVPASATHRRCVMMWLQSLQHQGDLPKTSVCLGLLPQLAAVPIVSHRFPLTWMHKTQILCRPELMAGRYIPGKFYPCLHWEKNFKVNKILNIFIPFKIWDRPCALSKITKKSSGYDWMTILWPKLLQISLLP